jgi:hypothetical protein
MGGNLIERLFIAASVYAPLVGSYLFLAALAFLSGCQFASLDILSPELKKFAESIFF